MTKKELIKKVAEELEMSQKEVGAVLEATLETVVESVKADEKVALAGFGTFEKKINKARTGVNPATGEKLQIAESKSMKFKVAKATKEKING